MQNNQTPSKQQQIQRLLQAKQRLLQARQKLTTTLMQHGQTRKSTTK